MTTMLEAKETVEPAESIEAVQAENGCQPHIGRAVCGFLNRQVEGLAVEGFSDALIHDALESRATDIHLDPFSDGFQFRFRIDGHLHDVLKLKRDAGLRVVNHFRALAGMDTAGPFVPADARLGYRVGDNSLDLRLSCVPAHAGEKLVMRLVDHARMEHRLEALGLGDQHLQHVRDWLTNINGMFIVCGPTGCGKTTTLYALLHELKDRDRSIVTIEDPVEYQVDGVTQVQVDRRHGLDFAGGVRAMLRLDPDYMVLGEMRDPSSAQAAVEACGSGRVLLTTTHSPDAAGAITAMRAHGVNDREIANAVKLVVAQRLPRRLCVNCRRKQHLNRTDRRWLRSLGLAVTTADSWIANGCDQCSQLGYHGRIGVFEVWKLNDSDYDMILAGSDERALRRHLLHRSGPSLLEDAALKASQGIISLDEMRAIVPGVPMPPVLNNAKGNGRQKISDIPR